MGIYVVGRIECMNTTTGECCVVYKDIEDWESWEATAPLREWAPGAWSEFAKTQLRELYPGEWLDLLQHVRRDEKERRDLEEQAEQLLGRESTAGKRSRPWEEKARRPFKMKHSVRESCFASTGH